MPLPPIINEIDTFNVWFDATNDVITHLGNSSALLLVAQNATPDISTGNVSMNGVFTTTNLTVPSSLSVNLTAVTVNSQMTVANSATFTADALVTLGGRTQFTGASNAEFFNRIVSSNTALLTTVSVSGTSTLNTVSVTGNTSLLNLSVSGNTTLTVVTTGSTTLLGGTFGWANSGVQTWTDNNDYGNFGNGNTAIQTAAVIRFAPPTANVGLQGIVPATTAIYRSVTIVNASDTHYVRFDHNSGSAGDNTWKILCPFGQPFVLPPQGTTTITYDALVQRWRVAGSFEISSVSVPVATTTVAGIVSTSTQSFAGAKTFTGLLGVTGGTLASSGTGLYVAGGLTTGRTGTYDSTTCDSIHTFFDTRTVEVSAGSTAGYVSGMSATGRGATLNSGTVRFLTYGAERMRIDNAGNVGIGLTSPTSKLHVTGTANVTANVTIGEYLTVASGNNGNPTIGQIWTQNTSSNLLQKSTPTHFVSNLGLITSSTTQPHNLYIYNESPTLRLTDTTASAMSGFLHVNGNVMYLLRANNATDGWFAINGQWPFTINLTNNDATFGGNVTVAGTAVTINGQTVIHSGNYTSYAPGLSTNNTLSANNTFNANIIVGSSGSVRLPDGAAATPAMRFTSASTAGLFRDGNFVAFGNSVDSNSNRSAIYCHGNQPLIQFVVGNTTGTAYPGRVMLDLFGGISGDDNPRISLHGKLIPGTDDAYDLGGPTTARWNNIYASLPVDTSDPESKTSSLVAGTSGRLYYTSSSARYKTHIQNLETRVDPRQWLSVVPRTYALQVEPDGREYIGFIAEELHDLGVTDVVCYKDGQPDSVRYDLATVYLTALVKDQDSRLMQQQSQIDALMTRLDVLESYS